MAFAFPPRLDDWRVGAMILAAVGRQQGHLAFDAIRGAVGGITSITAIPATATTPYGVYAISHDFVLVAVSGTASLLQWALNVLGSQQGDGTPIPGRLSAYWRDAALQIRSRIAAEVVPALETRRLVLLGHSLGGAIVQGLLSLWGPLALGGSGALVYGCPRVGNADFAGSVDPRVFRIETTFDPIVTVPPVLWAGQGSPWSWPFGIVPASYVHAGSAQTLDDAGNLTDGEQHISVTDAYQQLQALDAPSHLIEEYLRRLDLSADWAGIGGDYADPATLDEVDTFLVPRVGHAFQGDGPVATCQGMMFFRTTEESQGWSEAWYGDVAVPNMLDTLTALAARRANFLAGSCEIHALRASIVDPTVAKQSRTTILDNPIKATISIKDSAASGKTNDTMDSIDYLVTSTTNASKKTCSFRGIPDEWVTGSKLTDAGRDGIKRMAKFLQDTKDANLGLRVYKRGNDFPVKQVVAMGQDDATKLIKVTVTAHGFPANSLITLRKVKQNPMLQGRWRILVVDANNFLLSGSSKFFVTSSTDGTAQVYASQVDSIAGFQFSGVSTRRTGRPFGSRRGRRSAKLLHH